MLVPELRLFIEKPISKFLKKVLERHLINTRAHMTHLEDLQEDMAADILDEHCRTMKAMILETKELVDRCVDNELVERTIVASLRRITQCKIAVYEMLIAMADELSRPKQKQLLEQCLDDETNFDIQLKPLAIVGTSE